MGGDTVLNMPIIDRHVMHYIEGELFGHESRKRAISTRKTYIATERPGWDMPQGEVQTGYRPGGSVSNPTLARVLAIERDKELQALQRQVALIESALQVLPPLERDVVLMVYVARTHTISEAAEKLRLTPRHTRRLRHSAFCLIGMVLGVIHA